MVLTKKVFSGNFAMPDSRLDPDNRSPRESGEDSEDESEILEESPCGRWLKRREEVSGIFFTHTINLRHNIFRNKTVQKTCFPVESINNNHENTRNIHISL